jgi:nucleoside phosphorylase
LLNRFRNVINWSFLDPSGSPCALHFGPILSGEKLVDNGNFKKSLFTEFPTAIGGEMEGAGLAAAAERSRHDWIVVKGICDWADGQKSKQHQGFAAASAVSLVRHVLSQPSVLPDAPG